MKIKYKKLIIFTVILTIVLSMFCISSFALSHDALGKYTFSSELDLESFVGLDEDVSFSADGVYFYHMRISYRGYYVLEFTDANDEILVAYDSNDGWKFNSFRSIYIHSAPDSEMFYNFLKANEHRYFLYSELESVIVDALFGDLPLTGEQSISVSLVCTTLSLLVILLPFLVCGAIFVWILKRV